MLVGMALLIVGMYAWEADSGIYSFFIGFAVFTSGAAVAFAKAGEARRARAYRRRQQRLAGHSTAQATHSPAEDAHG
jgi:hypothetical protein